MREFLHFSILIPLLLIQGCTISCILSTMAVGTLVANDPRSIGNQIDDRILELRVKNMLSKDVLLKKKTHINAIVYQGTTFLVGQIPNDDLLFRAKKIIMNVEGVTKIFNGVQKIKPIGFSASLLDAWITTKAYFLLLTHDKVRFTNIKVYTENKEIFLFGIVTQYEGKIASEIVSYINGIKCIKIAFNYAN